MLVAARGPREWPHPQNPGSETVPDHGMPRTRNAAAMMIEWLKARAGAPRTSRPRGRRSQGTLFASSPCTMRELPRRSGRSAELQGGVLEHLGNMRSSEAIRREPAHQGRAGEAGQHRSTTRLLQGRSLRQDAAGGGARELVEAHDQPGLLEGSLDRSRARSSRRAHAADCRRSGLDLKLAQARELLTPGEGFEEFVAEVFEATWAHAVDRAWAAPATGGRPARPHGGHSLGVVQCKYHTQGARGLPRASEVPGDESITPPQPLQGILRVISHLARSPWPPRSSWPIIRSS